MSHPDVSEKLSEVAEPERSFQEKAITETEDLLLYAKTNLARLQNGVHRSRHRSIAITEMENVVARLEMDLKELKKSV